MNAPGRHRGAAAAFAARYDEMMLAPGARSLYAHSGHYNVGDWSAGAASLPEACAALVGRHARAIESAVTLSPGSALLDVGCGLGAGTSQLAARFPGVKVVGMNVSCRQLREAGARNPGIAFTAMDACCLALRDASVDGIACIEAAFHFEPRGAFLAEAFRVLRPGGVMVLSDLLFRRPGGIDGWWVPPCNATLARREYDDLCRGAGFEIVDGEDVTAATVGGFCEHLRAKAGLGQLADCFQACVSHYLLVTLRKPA